MFNYYGELFPGALKWLILLIISFAIIIIIALCIPQKKYYYEYVDLDNNVGTAEKCSYQFKEYGKGGQGSPICELADGTVKQVKEYKAIYDKTIIPLKEIFK